MEFSRLEWIAISFSRMSSQPSDQTQVSLIAGRFFTISGKWIVVQLQSCVWLFVTPWIASNQPSLSLFISWSLPKFLSIESVMLSNHLFLCHPLLLLPSVFPSMRVFSNELALCVWWPKYWSFSLNISPSTDYSGLISLLSKGVSGVSSTTVQKHQFFSALSSLWSSSHICTRLLEKIIALTIWTFVGKVMSLVFNTQSRFVIAFLPRSNSLLISWLHSPSAVILEPKGRKSVIASTFSPSICHEVMGSDAMILVFLILSFKLGFHSLPSPSSRGFWVLLHFRSLEWNHHSN